MDQESFRKLLETPNISSDSRTGSRGSLLAAAVASSSKKPKTVNASEPAFKPRKVKKSADGKYRDRAGERRVGQGNDFAEVEAVLEEFERRAAQTDDKAAIEEQRRYLGGDSDHSILVKGLDIALLEQNKARAALSTEDDDSLEQAFLEATSELQLPKKRTREELIRELKEKRGQKGTAVVEAVTSKTVTEEVRLLEEAKKAGKFKPIGFKPIGAPVDEKKKKKLDIKEKGKGGDRVKKRRKIDTGGPVAEAVKDISSTTEKARSEMPPPPVLQATVNIVSTDPMTEPDAAPEDFDIFADAGEYEGIDLGDDDDDEEQSKDKEIAPTLPSAEIKSPSLMKTELPPARWFVDDDVQLQQSTSQSAVTRISPPPKLGEIHSLPEDGEDGEVEQPMRLQPLQSSALPSIKDFLAMDRAVGAMGKRKKQKGKRKGGEDGDSDGKKLSAEVKADRDYKRLKTYTEKKAGSSSAK